MSLPTFFQGEIENLWKHTVKISLGRASTFRNWFCFWKLVCRISQKMLHNTSNPDSLQDKSA